MRLEDGLSIELFIIKDSLCKDRIVHGGTKLRSFLKPQASRLKPLQCLLLDNAVNQSRACEGPCGGTSVWLAKRRKAWLPHGRGLLSNQGRQRFANVRSATLGRKIPSARRS